VAVAGTIRSQFIGERFSNVVSLHDVPRLLMLSGGIGYKEAPIDPYKRNVPLECWWEEARQGIEFRLYMDGNNAASAANLVTRADLAGDIDAASTTTALTDVGKSLSVEPQTHKGQLLAVTGFVAESDWQRFFITSHTATVFTVPNSLFAQEFDALATQYHVLDQRYRTYVVDLKQMIKFDAVELPNIERFDLTIPLRKFIA
jgi:hypothetical protein